MMETVWQRVAEFPVGRLAVAISHDVLWVDFVGHDANGPIAFSWRVGADDMGQIRALFKRPCPDPPPSISEYFAELERRVARLEELEAGD